MTKVKCALVSMVVAGGFLLGASAAAQSTVVTFKDGPEGWDGNGSIEEEGGNPGFNAHFFIENFGIEFRTSSNPAFIGDLTTSDSITVDIDSKVNSITYEGNEVSRNMIVEFRSHALAQGGYPYASVWYNLGVLEAGPEWLTYTVTVDPSAQELPQGWGGYGAEDPDTLAPILPPGVTFADVMANTDELAFTTYEPGWFYGFTIFDVRIDNLSIARGDDGSDVVFSNGFEAR
jgi:hypothetical protein